MNVTRGALKVEGDGVNTCVSTENERRMVLRCKTYTAVRTQSIIFVGFLANEKTNLFLEDFESI